MREESRGIGQNPIVVRLTERVSDQTTYVMSLDKIMGGEVALGSRRTR
jgi:hypothetical protein